jgi:hypothetical protein
MRGLVLLLATALVFAGCLESATDAGRPKALGRDLQGTAAKQPIPVEWAELVLAGGDGHDHRNYDHHVGRSTANFEVLAYDPLITNYFGTTAGGHSCGDANEADGRRLAVVHSINNDVAFVIIDVTDSSAPRKLGELVMDNTQVYDVGITPDQRYVIAATTPLGLGPGNLAVPLAASWEDACTGARHPVAGPESGLPWAPGLVVVDIQNPQNPLIVDSLLYPVLGGHSIRITEIDGRIILLTAISGPPGYYALAELTEVAGRAKLVPLSFYKPTTDAGTTPQEAQIGGHDGFIQKHPVTGHDLAYLAYGTNGLIILDVDDLSNPRFVSRWNQWEKVGGGTHFLHGVLPMTELRDGKQYTFVGEECSGRPANYPTCLAYVFDTTDPADLKLVSAWSLPLEPEWREAAQFSAHYLDVVDGTLFIAMYHAGLWAIDVSTPENLVRMPSIGAFVPDRASPKPPPTYSYGAPAVLDFIPLSDGSMVVFDRGAGVYTVRFDPTNPAPSPEPWPVMQSVPE